MSRAIYLDYNAGSPARPEVVAALIDDAGRPGNASSVHGFGREARRRMEEARARIAALVEADPAGLVFTSGGTEANALALRGCGHRRVLVSAVEHPSVQDGLTEAEIIPVDGNGVVNLAALDALLAADSAPALVAVMLANNETGVIQPIADIARIAHSHGALLHCDAAQAAGRIPVSLSALGADLLSLSGHKLGGLPGSGALVLADPKRPLAPILLGGGQERRRRAGTENLPGIVGFGIAAALAEAEIKDGTLPLEIRTMRDHLEKQALRRVPQGLVLGSIAPRLPNTTCLALPGVAAHTQVMALDLAGLAVSAGSACSSGKVAESRVLAAMGASAEIRGSAIRVSLGWASTPEDVECFLSAWTDLASRKGFTVAPAAKAA
ncbi:Cysteine desulfurase [Candidatus Terasakiella magnetica]|nr:Cysteine desulfurase [Candidatus Terasakiella magnetica]